MGACRHGQGITGRPAIRLASSRAWTARWKAPLECGKTINSVNAIFCLLIFLLSECNQGHLSEVCQNRNSFFHALGVDKVNPPCRKPMGNVVRRFMKYVGMSVMERNRTQEVEEGFRTRGLSHGQPSASSLRIRHTIKGKADEDGRRSTPFFR